MSVWPSHVARRAANALLRAYRAEFMPEEWPSWGETECIFAITHSRLTPGTRLRIAHLWRQYGEVGWTLKETPEVQAELLGQLAIGA